MTAAKPLALVMGDIDVVQAFALAGIPSALYARPGDPARRSRHVEEALPFVDNWLEPERAVETLLAFARGRPSRPVLVPQTDGDLLVVSRHRAALAGAFDFLLADEELVETLVDKAAFAALAARLELATPRTLALDPRSEPWHEVDLRAPLVVKPLVRDLARWAPLEADAKAKHVATARELEALWPRLVELGLPVLVQEAIDGDETRIESFHAYVDADGNVAGAFTGRKIRTLPAVYGHSTALEVTDERDVEQLGRDVLERVGLRGFAKVDFKRDPAGKLWLLEINPRATLWHHPGAIAGVNLAALMYADLTGAPRPPVGRARPGVRWVLPLRDARAARAEGIAMTTWLRWMAGCEAISGFSRRDPAPLGAALWAFVRRRVPLGTPPD